LEVAAGQAPKPELAAATTQTATALRNATFALESARLMEDGTPPPTAEQLAEADTTTRLRRSELDAALERLQSLVQVMTTTDTGPSPRA
jgi:hypothetical protein